MKISQKQFGFSLLEMVVVTSIIMIGFIGVLILAEKTIKMRSLNQHYLVAVELAQEGLELTRYFRNDNWLHSINFDQNISDDNDNGTEGVISIFAIDNQDRSANSSDWNIKKLYEGSDNSQKLTDYIDSGCARLYISALPAYTIFIPDETEGENCNSNPPSDYSPTPYSRLVKTIYHDNGIVGNGEDDYLEVIVRVEWQDRGKAYNYTVSTYLYDYDWYY